MLYLFIFWELSGPSGARRHMNTEVRLALPSAKPSLPRRLLRWGGPTGGTSERPPKIANIFSKYLCLAPKILVSLEKQTRGVSNYGTGPAKLWVRLRLRDTAPPSPPYAYIAYEFEIARRRRTRK